MENQLVMQSTSAVKMIIFLKEHFGLLSSHDRNEEEIPRSCRLGLWGFGKGRGLAKRKVPLFPPRQMPLAQGPLSAP